MASRVVLAKVPGQNSLRAVKEIPAGNFGNSVSRYVDEMSASHNLAHVMVPDVLCVSEATIALAMTYESGGSLMSRILRNPVPIGEALPLLDDVLVGLHCLHARGVLHLDLHPNNVLIGRDGHAVIADVAQARQIDDRRIISHRSVLFDVPPECLLHGTCTEQSDVFQAALILFRAINGEGLLLDQVPPDSAAARDKIERGLLPSRNQYMPHIPRDLRSKISKGLQRDPRDRYESVENFRDALRSVELHLDWTVSIEDGEVCWRAPLGNTSTLEVIAATESDGLSVVASIQDRDRRTPTLPAKLARHGLAPADGHRHLEYAFDVLTDAFRS